MRLAGFAVFALCVLAAGSRSAARSNHDGQFLFGLAATL
jgi:hypothetical protein